MKIPPFKEINPPDALGYWTNKKTGEKYGGQYISPLLIPNLKKVEAGFTGNTPLQPVEQGFSDSGW